jgi:hypothetical protein
MNIPGLKQIVCVAAVSWGAAAAEQPAPWTLHTIDATSEGADGVRFADATGDGRMDIATPWEEGGVVRVYLNPGPPRSKEPWPQVTVGEVGSPEDAILVDLDGDGAMDVVSSCEGQTRKLYVHWAPSAPEEYLRAEAWQTEAMPMLPPVQWMYAAAADIDGANGIDLIIGGKNEEAVLGWLQSPENPRDLEAWKWHPLTPVGWTMSIVPLDFDHDGFVDILVSDRRGPTRGVFWLQHPGAAGPEREWKKTYLFGQSAEVMFLDVAHENGQKVIACATTDQGIIIWRETGAEPTILRIDWPEHAGTGKSVALGDIDLDGRLDMVISAEHALDAYGVQWTTLPLTAEDPVQWRRIATREGVKYDAVKLLDVDEDGDLDVVTCEERDDLGVIWYENPLR